MKEVFYLMDDNYEKRAYPVSEFKRVILGEVGEGQEVEENTEHPDIYRFSERKVLPEWRVEEELKKARTVTMYEKS